VTDKPRTLRVGGVIATTDFLPRRGIRISRDALQKMVDGFRPGGPIFSEHGARQIGRAQSLELRPRPDGEWEVYGEAEIDIPPGESRDSVLAGLPKGGWSMAITEVGEDAPTEPVATIAIDYLAFDERDREEARIRFRAVPVSVYVTWYHQFAEVPQPAVVLDLVRNAFLSMPPEVWNQLFKTLEDVVLRLIFREPKRSTPLIFRLRAGELRLNLEVPPDADPEIVREVFRGAQSVLRPSTRRPKKRLT
jgi:hypothetical protein